MLALNIGSSMESHISHLIASFFSSRPKGFSTKRIEKYIKLNDYKYNNINIFKLYLSTYSKKQTVTLNENTYDYEIFTQNKLHNIPVLNNGLKTGTYTILNSISHDISLNDIIENEIQRYFFISLCFKKFIILSDYFPKLLDTNGNYKK